MVDIFLLVFMVLWAVMAVLVNARMLFYYMLPHDRNLKRAVPIKLAIILSLSVAWFLILMLPLDVRNAQADTTALSLDMNGAWMTLYILALVFLVGVIPPATFYYEVQDDDDNKAKWWTVMWQWIICIIVVGLLLFILWLTSSTANISADVYDCPIGGICTGPTTESLELKVGFQIVLMAVMSFIGWFVFVSLGGIGLTSLPMSWILAFLDRPRPIDAHVYAEKKQLYAQTATKLLEQAESLSQRDADLLKAGSTGWAGKKKLAKLKADFNKFKKTSDQLETEFEKVQVAHNERGTNPLIAYSWLVIGVFLAIFSFMWWLHAILYILANKTTGFLNDLLTSIQGNQPGTKGAGFIAAMIIYSILNIHLLLAVISGCVKVGMRILCLPVHPMRKDNTPLNSFLFNVVIILLASCAIVQFSQSALEEYAVASASANIFQVQIKHLSWFTFFFKHELFTWLFVIFAVIAALFLTVAPRDLPELNLDKKANKAFEQMTGGMRKELAKAVVTGSVS